WRLAKLKMPSTRASRQSSILGRPQSMAPEPWHLVYPNPHRSNRLLSSISRLMARNIKF
ncbi:uncharacterized protein METZ01_LOCUS221589, partial [marine metagenome]